MTARCHACGQTTPTRHNLADPQSPAVTDALSRPCDQYHAQPGDPCTNHVDKDHGPLPGRLVHHGRLENP